MTDKILKYAFKIVMQIKCYDLRYKYNFLVIYIKKLIVMLVER